MAKTFKKIDFDKYFMPDLKKARSRKQSAVIYNDCFSIPTNIVGYGKNKNAYVRTYGCQSNVRDGETLKGILQTIGYHIIEDEKDADLIILNTCAIRENAEQKVFGEIGFLKQLKVTKPNLIFGIAGCMSQEKHVVERILSRCDNVDFVIGTHNIFRLPQVLEGVILSQNTVVEVWSKEGDIIENTPSYRDSNIKAWVNIMYGCDKFCTYCIVPYTRGKQRSRSKEDILSEIHDLIKQGYQEITLLGQNVNSYGKDLKDGGRFADLLDEVASLPIPRIRFTTSNPFDWTNDIIDVIKKHPNIMPYLHLPVQSGSEEILRKMNRVMSIDQYLKNIEYIRQNIPDVAISTDIIVGFPNETDEQFQATLDLYDKVKYDNAYTFIYSPREGTPAAGMIDNIDMETKINRLNALNEKVKQYAKENNDKFVGRVLSVLVEGPSKTNPDVLTGYSPNWKVVNFTGNAQPGTTVNVKIVSANRFSLNGELVEK